MSFAETRQIMADLQEIIRLLNSAQIRTQQVVDKAPQARGALRTFTQLERVALRYISIAKKSGLPPEIAQQVQLISELVVMLRMAQISVKMLMLATPYGQAMGIAGLVLTTLGVTDFIMNMGG